MLRRSGASANIAVFDACALRPRGSEARNLAHVLSSLICTSLINAAGEASRLVWDDAFKNHAQHKAVRHRLSLLMLIVMWRKIAWRHGACASVLPVVRVQGPYTRGRPPQCIIGQCWSCKASPMNAGTAHVTQSLRVCVSSMKCNHQAGGSGFPIVPEGNAACVQFFGSSAVSFLEGNIHMLCLPPSLHVEVYQELW